MEWFRRQYEIISDGVVPPRLLYIDERAKSWGPQSVLVMGFYTARYIVGMFVTGFLNEAH
jgi:hypothetical protein